MRWKTTVFLLMITIGIGAYVALYELKQPTQEEQQELAKQVVHISADEVTQLNVDFPEAKVTLERKNGLWRLISPLAVRAEGSLAERILNELAPFVAQRVLEGSKDKPLAPADFGLEPPRGTLTVIAGGRETKLLFGEETPVGDNRYLKLPDSPNVFVTSSRLFEELDQSVESFRSHELLAFDTWNATRITVTSERASYTLTKQDDRWRLTQPLNDEADSAAASTTLSKLRGLKIERFIADPPVPPAGGAQAGEPRVDQVPEWGFDAPYAQIAVAMDKGAKPLELFAGKPTTDNAEHLYAKRTDEPTIYAVAKARIDELLQDPQMLRSRTVLDFFTSEANKLHVSWQDRSWMVEKVDGQWKIPEGNVTLESSKVEDLLVKLREMKLTRFVEDPPAGGAGAPQDLGRYGLDSPKGKIQILVTDQQEPQELLIGDPIEQGQTRYGRITGRAAVVELPETLNEILNTTPESLKAQSEPPTTST